MSITLDQTDNGLLIRIDGRFDFSDHTTFRDLYKNKESDQHVTVDLMQCEYLDSSALGMLLLLREHFGGDKSGISIISTGNVRSILELSNFDALFKLS